MKRGKMKNKTGKVLQKFRKLPTSLIILHISSRVILGIGFGILIAYYFNLSNYWAVAFIILGLLLSIPTLYKLKKMKK